MQKHNGRPLYERGSVPDGWIKTSEFAEMIQKDKQTVHRWIKIGKIKEVAYLRNKASRPTVLVRKDCLESQEESDSNIDNAKLKSLQLKNEFEELKLLKAKNEVISFAKVEEAWTNLAADLKHHCFSRIPRMSIELVHINDQHTAEQYLKDEFTAMFLSISDDGINDIEEENEEENMLPPLEEYGE